MDDWEKFFFNSSKTEKLKRYFDVQIYHDKPSNEALIERIKDADIIIPVRERTVFTKEILQQLNNIKLIAQTGAGLAHIDMEEATRLKIPVSTTPGGSASVVELIFGFMIAYSRKIISLNEEMKRGIWTDSAGLGLDGKTVGIIGLGKIGSGVAKVAKAFNMNVIAWGPRLTPDRAIAQSVEYSSLENLLQTSHFVVIAVRLVPETKNLLKEHHFNLMKKDSFLINTSRGDVLDEQALLQALKENRIGGAGLDVFSQEPISPENPLLQLNNVILSPHIGWKTDNMFDMFLTASIENILSYVIDNLPIRIANPEALRIQKQ